MRTGRSLTDLAAELSRQKAAKKDYLVDTRALTFEPIDVEEGRRPTARLRVKGLAGEGIAGGDGFDLAATAHGQFAERTGIPKRYYDRMATEAPDLLCQNLNHWLHANPGNRLLRTIDGNARALLSDRYRPLDNYEFAEATLPIIGEVGAEVRSCEVTDRRFYLKVVRPDLKAEIGPPNVEDWKWGQGHHQVHVVEAGLVLSNSEVGDGALAVSPAVHTVHCTNLAISRENTDRRTHLGRMLGSSDKGDQVRAYLSDETKRTADAAVWMAIADLTRASLDGSVFQDQVNALRAARADVAQVEPTKLVEKVADHFTLTDGEAGGVLEHLLAGQELTRYAVSAAITRASQDADDYDRATTLERLGGDVIDLTESQWRAVSA